MFNPKRFRVVFSLLGISIFLFTAALGCQQFTGPSPFPVTASPTESPTQPLLPSPVPGAARHAMVVSLEEAGFAHLFLFAPEPSSFTRLTYGPWNDTTPSLSPDGKRVAFASNRGGHWDLYTLELDDGQVTQLTNTPEFDFIPLLVARSRLDRV